MYAILRCDHIVLSTCTNILVIFSRLYVFVAYLDRNGDITKSRNIFKKNEWTEKVTKRAKETEEIKVE